MLCAQSNEPKWTDVIIIFKWTVYFSVCVFESTGPRKRMCQHYVPPNWPKSRVCVCVSV